MANGSESSSGDVLLLDTNILIVYAREGEPSRRLEQILHLQDGHVEALISVVTKGEALAFARKGGWGNKKVEKLRDMLRTKVAPVDISRPEIIDAYAEVDYFSQKTIKPSRNMGKNDLWIAATARVLGCTLVTTDGDFDHLDKVMLSVWKIPVEQLKPTS